MKKLLLFSFLLFFVTFQIAKAQTENDPCSAPCLSFSGSTSGASPAADGFSPNVYLPCGATEDNPTWYTFVPSGNTFTINVSTSGCVANNGDTIGIEIAFYKAEDCGAATAINCLNCVTSGTLTMNCTPCKQYWIQIDGCKESVCNFTLTYNPNQLLKNVPAPVITGEQSVCLGKMQTYCASLPNGCEPSGWIWTTIPAGKATIVPDGNCADVKWASIGTFKLLVKPKFNVKCPPQTITTTEYTVYVNDKLKDTTCMATFCCENQSFDFPLLPCIKTANPNVLGNSTPLSVPIFHDCGTTKTYKIPYKMGCEGNINLVATIKNNIPLALTSKIKNSTGKNGAIDLTVTSTKTTTFMWSNGATTEDISNLAPGNYCVTVTDVESCIKYQCFTVKDVSASEETEIFRGISIFPNPVNDILFIKIEENIILTKIELLDTKGSVLSVFSSETRQINMINLPSAVYFLKCYTKDDFVVKRIVR